MLSFTLSDADGTVISSSYAYDNLNRITSATNNTITETYVYDNNSNLTGRTNTAVSVLNQYNKANWQVRARNVASTTDDILGYYNYDGTLARTMDRYDYGQKDDLLINYTYDGLNRLTSENVEAEEGSSVSSYSDTFTFDDNNNRATLDNGTYSYDANNRMLSSPDSNSYSYSDGGLLNSDGTYTYVYDGFNRLVQVKDYTTNDVIASYTYNGDGQRITKTVDGVTTTYVWNGDNIVYETTGTTEQKYYYGTILYAMEDTSGNVYYYGKNIHGDVVELYDEDGEYVRDYRYDAFGNQKTANANDTNPFRYAGEYYDKETGLIYLRNRYYDTRTGRFITEDPIRDGLNWYVYCGNNPVMFVDPLGLAPGDPFESMDLAALDFAILYNEQSINHDNGNGGKFNGREYGSKIYSFKVDGKVYYSYTVPITAPDDDVHEIRTASIKIPEDTEWVGNIHTHAPNGADGFSNPDEENFDMCDYHYLVTTSGKIKMQTRYMDDPITLNYVVYADQKSGAWINSKPEYKDEYQDKYDETLLVWTTYNNMKNTLLWRLLLYKYSELKPLDIVEARTNSSSILETIQTLDAQK